MARCRGRLEWLGVPYTGSGVLASALTMDKLKTKRVVVGAGYAAPEYAVLSGPADLAPALDARRLAPDGQARLVKARASASPRSRRPRELPAAYAEAQCRRPIVFAEAFISGDEYTVGVLQDAALPSIRIQPATEFYDYEAKYFRNDTQYSLPERTRRDRPRRNCRRRRSRPSE